MKNEKLNKFNEKASKISNLIGDSVTNFVRRFDIEIFFLAITAIAVLIRIFLFQRVSQDIKGFLIPWYQKILDDPSVLGTQVGDYTPAYLYYLWFISLFKVPSDSQGFVTALKVLSVIFDFGCAVFGGLIVYHKDKSKFKAVITYGLILMCVTVFLNSSWWGQCDSIFTCFCVASVYFYLSGHHRTSMIMYGVAFAFKLQSIFILPLYFILAFRRELKFKYFLWIPIVYVLFALPSCFVSGHFFSRLWEIFKVYAEQTGNSYKQLSLNAGNFYTIIFTNYRSEDQVTAFSVPLAIGIIGTYGFSILHSKKKLDNDDYLRLFTLFAIAMPFFLPHMHDRYYYLADVLVIVYAVMNPRKCYVAPLEVMNSMIGYMSYLWGLSFVNNISQTSSATYDSTKALSFRVGGLLCAVALIVLSYDAFKKLYPGCKNPPEVKENKEPAGE